MKKWLGLWIFCIPIFIISFIYSFFITSKVAYLPQSECKPMFIFTPQDVQYCSEIYPIDIFLISLKTEPLSYICLISGLYLIGFIIYLLKKILKP
ncbi:DUF4306 domain-containing protein [Neobacillus sp. PS3-40]|uniref:DUF4306 domain-containing protein n=1 Tax=Neobacillus sp. PS3-40 TaxID=3070679 RepID=UPI0027DF901E|nr:DUF4306 domain-containing protein [Neobacillus sp. PS3-40]WML44597.1 DUF4306 domain-containing protein [Neobacillus sp. PS3-40]